MKTSHLTIGLAAMLAIGVLFWPTLYRYDRMITGTQSFPVRINRVTGRTQILFGTEWVNESRSASNAPRHAERTITFVDPEFDQIKGTSSRILAGYFEGSVYNGSGCYLSALYVEVIGKNSSDLELWRRQFKVPVTIQPLASGSFSFEFGGMGDAAKTTPVIDSAVASCAKE